MKNESYIIITIMTIILVNPVFASVERTSSTDTFCSIEGNTKTCTKTLYSGQVNYLDNGVYRPIDTTITTSSFLTYDFEMTKGIYKAYFQDNINTGEAVRFEKDGYHFIYDLSGGKMQWIEQEGNPTKTKSIGAILSSVPTIKDNKIIYENGFLNTNVSYFVFNEMLKENFILKSLPTGGADFFYLDFTGEIKHSSNLTIFANGENQTDKNFQTNQKIEFRDVNQNTIFYLPQPTITDADGDVDIGLYDIKISAGKIQFGLRANKTFLENAVYPVVIDPTVRLQDADTENLKDSDVTELNPNSNNGADDELQIFIQIFQVHRVYLMFNMTSIPSKRDVSGLTILDATLHIFKNGGIQESTIGVLDVHYVNDSSWAGQSESTITWNNQVCGTNFDDGTKCDLTAESNVNPTGTDNVFLVWNVTSGVNSSTEKFLSNVSFAIKEDLEADTDSGQVFMRSKEHGTVSERPFLDISYTIPIPAVTLKAPLNTSSVLFADRPFQFNFTIQSTIDIKNATLWWNISNVWQQNITNSSFLNWSETVDTKTVNITTNLSRGYFAWSVNVYNTNGDFVFASNFTIQINNSLPIALNVSITSLPLDAGTAAKGHLNHSDADGDKPNTNETIWYINDSRVTEADNSFTLGAVNVTNNANITFSARFQDNFSGEFGDYVNSTTVTVGDSTPPDIFGNSTQGKTSFTTSEIVNITVNVTDAVGSIDLVKVVINRTGTSTTSNNTMILLGGNLYQFAQTFAEDTHKIISFQANDGSGNIQITESILPSFTVTSPPGGTATGGGGGGGGKEFFEAPKKDCNLNIEPSNLTFFVPTETTRFTFVQPDTVKQSFILSKENFSISPTLIFPTLGLVILRGDISKIIKPFSQQELIFVVNETQVKKIASETGNNTIVSNLILSSKECKDIVLPIIISTESSLETPLANLKNIFISPIKQFDNFSINLLGITSVALLLSIVFVFTPHVLRQLRFSLKIPFILMFTVILSLIMRIIVGLI